jgi:hypothetical protein
MIHNNNKKNENQTEGGRINHLTGNEVTEFDFDVAIKIAFPLKFQRPLVELAQSTLDLVQEVVDDELLKQVFTKVNPFTFGRFFGRLGLSDQPRTIQWFFSDLEIFVARVYSGTQIEWFVDAINNSYENAKRQDDIVNDVSSFLAKSKDDLINDYIIPFFRLPKEGRDFDLQVLLESAFDKMILRIFPENCTIFDDELPIIYDRLAEFTIEDCKLVFDYCSAKAEDWTKAILLEEETFDDFGESEEDY